MKMSWGIASQAVLSASAQAQDRVMLCLFGKSTENGAGGYPIFP